MGKIIFYNELDISQEVARMETKPINLRNGKIESESPYGKIETTRFNITEGFTLYSYKATVKYPCIYRSNVSELRNIHIILSDNNKDGKVISPNDVHINTLGFILFYNQHSFLEFKIPQDTELRWSEIVIDEPLQLRRNLRKGSYLDGFFYSKDPMVMSLDMDEALGSIYQEHKHTIEKAEDQLILLKAKSLLLLNETLLSLERQKCDMGKYSQYDIQKIFTVKTMLLKDLANPPSLEFLAENSGMSVSKLNRLFKVVFGKPPYSFYSDYRMEEAYRLLRMGTNTVSEIGYKLGYSNLSKFSAAFKKHHNLLPRNIKSMKLTK
ncbi:AraC family transcriptional regulator [Halosquirtibacter laminarini]|uniref:AraC family transcriptional regulator n=1 Tax=Halosquirtibacter laminarini TaxID=3374600 RepID=A0AC61NG11_9BACT|nr:AraC family transcriptional regulator [Prolixibacteraceae bacterium]